MHPKVDQDHRIIFNLDLEHFPLRFAERKITIRKLAFLLVTQKRPDGDLKVIFGREGANDEPLALTRSDAHASALFGEVDGLQMLVDSTHSTAELSVTFDQAAVDALGADLVYVVDGRDRFNPDMVRDLIVLPTFDVSGA